MTEHALAPSTYEPPQWHRRGPAVYIEGRAHLDGVDHLAAEMERKWGVDRLRLLVGPEARHAFDSQRAKLNKAVWHGDLDDLKREAERMSLAWRTLDRMATEAGASPIEPEVLAECVVEGTVIAIVRDDAAAGAVLADGRRRQVWTLAEIERVIVAFPEVIKSKNVLPGTNVARSKPPQDPLQALMDDEIPWL